MKDISNSTANAVTAIHGLTFTVFFILDSILNEFFYPFLQREVNKVVAIAISAIIAAVLYFLVLTIVKKIYDFVLCKKDLRLSIDGMWYHVHIPRHMGKEDYSYEQLSCGETRVSRNLYDFTFVGDNCKFSVRNGELIKREDNATHWYTKATKLSDENDFDIVEIYEAKTTSASTKKINSCPFCKSSFDEPIDIQVAEKFRHGIHKIDIITTNPNNIKMRAEYSDCYPSFKSGTLLFYRTEAERDERVKQFFLDAEEWRSSQNK